MPHKPGHQKPFTSFLTDNQGSNPGNFNSNANLNNPYINNNFSAPDGNNLNLNKTTNPNINTPQSTSFSNYSAPNISPPGTKSFTDSFTGVGNNMNTHTNFAGQ